MDTVRIKIIIHYVFKCHLKLLQYKASKITNFSLYFKSKSFRYISTGIKDLRQVCCKGKILLSEKPNKFMVLILDVERVGLEKEYN